MSSGRNLELLTPLLGVDAALQRLGGDVELLDQIILIYLDDAPVLMHTAQQSLAQGDAVELRRAAHSLKGMLATLGAHRGVTAASQLEQCAVAGDLADAAELLVACGECNAELAGVLETYCHSGETHDAPARVRSSRDHDSAASRP